MTKFRKFDDDFYHLLPYLCPTMWAKEDIRLRVEARLKQLGKKLDEVLPGYDTFFMPSKAGSTTVASLEKLAKGLEWSLCELLCERGPSAEPLEATLDRVREAVTIALVAIPSDRMELVPGATVSSYENLLGLEEDGEELDERARRHLVRQLRVQNKVR